MRLYWLRKVQIVVKPVQTGLFRHYLYGFVLILAPFLVYGPAVSHHYGMRDDYSLLREAHEEAGKAIWFTGSHGRPIYGAMLEAGFKSIHAIDDLIWLRLISVAALTWLGLILWRQFRASGWPELDAFAAAISIVFLPASQITASWTVGWPWGFSLILAAAGFRLAESAYQQQNLPRRYLSIFTVAAIYITAALIYQSNVLFIVVLMAAILLSPSNQRTQSAITQWLLFHMAVLIGALALYYGLLQILFTSHILYESGRLQLETNFISKINWFFQNPLPNSLAFFTLRDDFNTGAIFFWSGVVVVIILIASAIYRESTWSQRIKWMICLVLLPWIAHAISLTAAERVTGYRTCYALSGLFVVMFFMALHRLININKERMLAHSGVVVLLVLFFGYQASCQTTYLIALPQEREWKLISNVVNEMPINKKHIDTYLIEPNVKDRSTERVFRDEFGSLSADSDWTPKEMFKDAISQRFPNGIPKGLSISLLYTKALPNRRSHFDYLIDMRNLRHWRDLHNS